MKYHVTEFGNLVIETSDGKIVLHPIAGTNLMRVTVANTRNYAFKGYTDVEQVALAVDMTGETFGDGFESVAASSLRLTNEEK